MQAVVRTARPVTPAQAAALYALASSLAPDDALSDRPVDVTSVAYAWRIAMRAMQALARARELPLALAEDFGPQGRATLGRFLDTQGPGVRARVLRTALDVAERQRRAARAREAELREAESRETKDESDDVLMRHAQRDVEYVVRTIGAGPASRCLGLSPRTAQRIAVGGADGEIKSDHAKRALMLLHMVDALLDAGKGRRQIVDFLNQPLRVMGAAGGEGAYDTSVALLLGGATDLNHPFGHTTLSRALWARVDQVRYGRSRSALHERYAVLVPDDGYAGRARPTTAATVTAVRRA